WTMTSNAGPAPLGSAPLIYDPTRQAFLLVDASAQTWSYASQTWTQLTTQPTPPAREGEQLIFDSLRQKTVMLGGFDSQRFYTNDLWQLDRTEDGKDAWHL